MKKIEKKCCICQKTFFVVPSRANLKTTCGDKECISKNRSNKNSGINNGNWNGGKILKYCVICKKEFYVKRSHSWRINCSKKCGYLYLKEKNKGINYREKNNMWKGDNVGFNGLHSWINRNKPKVKLCENCKKVPPYDLANISGEYKRDINDFKWLCRKCHMEEDGRLKKFIKTTIKNEVFQ